MSPARLTRPALALAALSAAAALVAGCGTAGTPVPVHHRQQSVVFARAGSNGKTLRVHVGDRVSLVLASTYWQLGGSSAPGVLRQSGPARYHPSGGCVPGAGCGTLFASFAALKAGTAVITAHRTSCGEALLCGRSSRRYLVTIVVS